LNFQIDKYYNKSTGEIMKTLTEQMARLVPATHKANLDEEIITENNVSIKKNSYHLGKMMTVHDGIRQSFPLCPEHQEKIRSLKDGESTHFFDETNAKVKATRQGDKVHLAKGERPTTVSLKHFNEDRDKPEEMKDKDNSKEAIEVRKELARLADNKRKGKSMNENEWPDGHARSPFNADGTRKEDGINPSVYAKRRRTLHKPEDELPDHDKNHKAANIVTDRKTGKTYDPHEEMKKHLSEPSVVSMLKRLKDK